MQVSIAKGLRGVTIWLRNVYRSMCHVTFSTTVPPRLMSESPTNMYFLCLFTVRFVAGGICSPIRLSLLTAGLFEAISLSNSAMFTFYRVGDKI